jgi:microcystin-dependent protein
MSDPFIAEIRITPYNFAPRGWAFCNGQTLSISQNTALFSLLGTNYGGNGVSTFNLPNLQGRAPLHQGQGQGLSLRILGEPGGQDTTTLLAAQMPLHTHGVRSQTAGGNNADPAGNVWASPGATRGLRAYNPAAGTGGAMAPTAISVTGSGQPHNNLMPYLALNFVIALQGIYPPRS